MARGGKTRTSGQGRPKGAINKLTADVKELILGALADVGGRDYLAQQALANPAAFLVLIGKVLPLQVHAQLTGKDEGPIEIADARQHISGELDRIAERLHSGAVSVPPEGGTRPRSNGHNP